MATLVRWSTASSAAPRQGNRLASTSVPISAKVKLSGKNLGQEMAEIRFIGQSQNVLRPDDKGRFVSAAKADRQLGAFSPESP